MKFLLKRRKILLVLVVVEVVVVVRIVDIGFCIAIAVAVTIVAKEDHDDVNDDPVDGGNQHPQRVHFDLRKEKDHPDPSHVDQDPSELIKIETKEPRISALCQPKDILWLVGSPATQMAIREIMKVRRSVKRCKALVAIARLLERTPPTTSMIMKMRQIKDEQISL